MFVLLAVPISIPESLIPRKGTEPTQTYITSNPEKKKTSMNKTELRKQIK